MNDESRIKRQKTQHVFGSDDENYHANQNALLCHQTFEGLAKSGKPDPVREHTVLACILQHSAENETQVVVLATGTKCFPQNLPAKREKLVDCHAEPLVKRCFKKHLLELYQKWIGKQGSSEIKAGDFYEQGKLLLFLELLD